MEDIEIAELKAYISSLSATDRVMLKRKVLGLKTCPKRVINPDRKVVNELPEEIALREFKAGLKAEELSLITEYQKLVDLARTARFKVGLKRGY